MHVQDELYAQGFYDQSFYDEVAVEQEILRVKREAKENATRQTFAELEASVAFMRAEVERCNAEIETKSGLSRGFWIERAHAFEECADKVSSVLEHLKSEVLTDLEEEQVEGQLHLCDTGKDM